jgi:tripartite-type tricarboxylate transporter receptor subunit TctC
MVHVPYRGINEALTDLIAGRTQLSFAGAPIALPHAKTGKVRALAVTGAVRTSSAPELPTIAQSGLPGYDVTPWYGVVAPRQRRCLSSTKLHQDLVRTMQLADVKERWIAWGRRSNLQQVTRGVCGLDAVGSGKMGEAGRSRYYQTRMTP